MAKKIDTEALQAFINKITPEEIYKLHMAQARSSQKMFADNPEALAKIDAIIVKIKQTYANSQKEAAQ
jgi:GDP-D-mannose dehydratase